MANMPDVISRSGRSVSIPTRKLRPNDMRLQSNNPRPPAQKATPIQGERSDRKNSWLLTAGGGEESAKIINKKKQGKRWNQEVFFVYVPEFHCLYSLPVHQQDTRQHHSD